MFIDGLAKYLNVLEILPNWILVLPLLLFFFDSASTSVNSFMLNSVPGTEQGHYGNHNYFTIV